MSRSSSMGYGSCWPCHMWPRRTRTARLTAVPRAMTATRSVSAFANGLELVGWIFEFALSAYNLLRMRKSDLGVESEKSIDGQKKSLTGLKTRAFDRESAKHRLSKIKSKKSLAGAKRRLPISFSTTCYKSSSYAKAL